MILSSTYRPQIHAEVIGFSSQFNGKAVKTRSDGDLDIYRVDQAVEVTDLSEKVRQTALEQFQKGFFSDLLAGFGGFCLFSTFVVMPVSSLAGYRIANSHLAHAAVAFATFIVGFSCLVIGLGDTVEDAAEKKFFNTSLVSQVQAARLSAGRDPLSFLLSDRTNRFQYFHPRELLKLVVQAKNGKAIGAGSDKKKADCLLECAKLFKNDELNQTIVKEASMTDGWQSIVADWDALELDKPFEEAAEKRKKLNRELDAAKNITRAPGNMFTGLAGMVEENDPQGAAVVGGMGQAFNFFVDQTINSEIEDDVNKEMSKIEKDMFAAVASKWAQAMAIFDRINRL